MRIAADFGLDATLVPNAIDHDQFYLTAPLEHRSATKILFPSLPKQIKGSRDVVRALNVLQKEGLAFDVTAFGRVDPAEFGLEGDYVYEPDPSQDVLRGLYNGAGVFVNASLIEGWGLTIAEAAACGAALVVSDIGGHRELASPDNALLFAPGAVDQIAARLRRLRAEPYLREKLARLAMVDVTQYNWERASAAMSRALAL
jgi:glycosyltransferase involved in cell wall biosynthesis